MKLVFHVEHTDAELEHTFKSDVREIEFPLGHWGIHEALIDGWHRILEAIDDVETDMQSLDGK